MNWAISSPFSTHIPARTVMMLSYPIQTEHLDAPVPRITIPMLTKCPEAVLPLPPGECRRMAEIPFLVNFMDGTCSPDRARFWLAYDSHGIEVAGRLYAPDHGRDDVVENQVEHEQLQILINPTPSKPKWYRIRMRPDRVMMINGGGGAPDSWWSEEGKLAQRVDKDGWSFVAYIPFALLGVRCPRPGAKWRLNFFRYEYKRQEDNSSWSVMYLGRTDIPERYGELVFGGRSVCGGLLRARVLPGRSQASFLVVNLEDRDARVTIEASHGLCRVARVQSVVGSGRKRLDAEFDLPDGGEALLTMRSSGREIARFPLNTGCKALKARVSQLRRTLMDGAKARPVVVRTEASHIRSDLGRLQEAMRRKGHTVRSWKRLESNLAKLEVRASMLRYRSGLRDPRVGGAILSCHSLVKILPARPLPGVLSPTAKLKAPRRGCDSAQLVVLAFDHELANCIAEVGPFTGRQGAQLGREGVEIWRVGSVVTRRPRYTVEYVGPHPDPLLPAEPFTVQKGGFEVLWLTVSVPEDVPAGTYRGWVEIKPSNCDPLRIPLSIKVWGFELPVRSTLRTAFPMFEKEIETFYRRPLSKEQRWLYYDFLLRRRISPSCQYEEEPRPRIEDLDRVMERGSNVISMGYLQEQRLPHWIEGLRPTVEFLRKNGWLRWAYLYGFDEVIPEGYAKLREAYGAAKLAYPDLRRACTIGPSHDLPQILGTVDIWVPQTDRFEAIYKDRQSKGEELWWYVSMWPRHPFANVFVDYPALDHRILFWQTWKYGITGFLYYCINLWSSNCVGEPSLGRETAALPDPAARQAIDKGARWPQVPWNTYTGPTATNGDGQLIYPGPDGGPLSSVRLECIRHGIEDYEMLARLQREVERLSADSRPETLDILREAKALLKIPGRLCQDLTHFSRDPEVLLRTREEIGDLTEKMVSV